MRPISYMVRGVSHSALADGLSVAAGWLLVVLPFVIFALFTVALLNESTASFTRSLLWENRPVELLTFAVLLGGGGYGLSRVRRFREAVNDTRVTAFYGMFSIGLLLIAMEEISWGQQFLDFPTPAWLEKINAQDEVTLHNLDPLQKHLEYFAVSYSLIGGLGLALGFHPSFKRVAPSPLLLTWFAAIGFFAVVDLVHDWVFFTQSLRDLTKALDELVECMVAISAALYLWLNRRFLRGLGAEIG